MCEFANDLDHHLQNNAMNDQRDFGLYDAVLKTIVDHHAPDIACKNRRHRNNSWYIDDIHSSVFIRMK